MQESVVEIRTQDGVMDTFVCHPDEGGAHPAVIFYMDAPGIREELRDMARRIGTVGYTVLLPNLFYRTGTEGNYGFDLARIRTDEAERDKMIAVMNQLTNARVVADTAPMLDFAHGHAAAAEGPVGCVGYCMSGQYVVAVAAEYPDDFAAIASYYGVRIITEEPDSPHLTADRIKGELYLAFAEQDHWVPPELLARMRSEFAAAGTNHRIEVYPGTEHGFAFPQRPAYHKPAAERHWQRLHALLARNLKG